LGGQQVEGFEDGGRARVVEEEDQGFDGCYGHGEIGVFAEEAVVGFDDAGGGGC